MNKPVETPKTDKTVKRGKAAATRTTRFEMRLSPYVRKVIERAAEIQGRSMSDYMVTAAHEAAKKTIADMHVIELTLTGQEAFAEAILNPPKPGPALRKAKKSYERLIRESR